MSLDKLTNRALEIHNKYSEFNQARIGRPWTRSELAQGFIGDVGDLMKLVMAKEGIREIVDVDNKLSHELSDCLWSILVLADAYKINLEESFENTMDELEARFN